jgi:hypothetical protein
MSLIYVDLLLWWFQSFQSRRGKPAPDFQEAPQSFGFDGSLCEPYSPVPNCEFIQASNWLT